MTKPTKQRGNPTLRVRIPKRLLRRYGAVAKIYGAELPVFTREMIAAVVDAETKLRPFLERLTEGMAKADAKKRQLELKLVASEAASAGRGRPTGGDV